MFLSEQGYNRLVHRTDSCFPFTWQEDTMAHLAPVADAQASETVKGIFQSLQAKLGKVLNFFRTMAHAPDVLQATLALNQAIQKELDPKLRELAYLKTTQLNNCNY
jgi:alkylhydroperoxidase family enzyme